MAFLRAAAERLTLAGALAALFWSRAHAVSTADEICAPSDDPCVVTRSISVDDGAVLDFRERELRVSQGGALDGGSGSYEIRAGRVIVEAGGRVTAQGAAGTGGGSVSVDAAEVVSIGGTIDVSGVPAGSVDIVGSRVEVSGSILADAMASESGGSIGLTATEDVIVAGLLSASGSNGDGGDIDIEAGGNVVLGAADRRTAKVIDAGVSQGFGFGGDVSVTAGDPFQANGSGTVSLYGVVSATGGSSFEEGGGDGGNVDVTSTGDCTIGGTIDVSSAVGEDATGGQVSVTCGVSGNGGISTSTGAVLLALGRGTGAFGGSIELGAPGAIVLAGATIDASGAEAQGVSIRSSGRRDSAVVVESGSVIRADGPSPGGAGGDVSL